MKFGLAIGYSGAQLDIPVELVQRAEELGYDSVWTAEAYGSDAVTPLAYLAAMTRRIRLGTGIMQLAARTPANAAMRRRRSMRWPAAAASSPGSASPARRSSRAGTASRGASPTAGMQDYVAIMRKIFEREEPVTHDGREISPALHRRGRAGLGKPLKSILHMNPDIPI